MSWGALNPLHAVHCDYSRNSFAHLRALGVPPHESQIQATFSWPFVRFTQSFHISNVLLTMVRTWDSKGRAVAIAVYYVRRSDCQILGQIVQFRKRQKTDARRTTDSHVAVESELLH